MLQANQPVARGFKPQKIGHLALQRVRALDAQHATDNGLTRCPAGQHLIQISQCANNLQAFGRISLHPGQLFRLIKRALHQALPCAHRPKLGGGEQGYVVKRVSRVFLIVQPGRRFGDSGKHLHRNIALDQPRNIGLPVSAALGEVTVPQQAVGVPIGNDQAIVQRLCLGRDKIRRVLGHHVALPLHIAGGKNQKADKAGQGNGKHKFNRFLNQSHRNKSLLQGPKHQNCRDADRDDNNFQR